MLLSLSEGTYIAQWHFMLVINYDLEDLRMFVIKNLRTLKGTIHPLLHGAIDLLENHYNCLKI